MAGDQQQKDEKALTMFLAAIPLDTIRDKLGYRTVTQAEAAVRRAVAANQKRRKAVALRDIEVERIDAIYRAVYPLALKGEVNAIDRCLKLADQRMRLLDHDGDASGLHTAYEQTIDALDLEDSDLAAIEAGRSVARQIDEVLEHGQPQERTKALYLLPHLMTVLRELGATPAAREAISGQARSKGGVSSGSKLEALQAGVGFASVEGEATG